MAGNNELMKRLLQSSAIVAIGVGSFTTGTLAQGQVDPDEDQIEQVIVTGSRIRRDAFSSPAPMDIITTEEADARGILDVATLLQTTTIATASMLNHP